MRRFLMGFAVGAAVMYLYLTEHEDVVRRIWGWLERTASHYSAPRRLPGQK